MPVVCCTGMAGRLADC